jgi:hypothetical protein
VPGDYDGDGRADLGLFRPSTGIWYILKSTSNFTAYSSTSFGLSSDIPVPGDYDGDGKTDLALYRASTGTWYLMQSTTNNSSAIAPTWGAATDIPVFQGLP